MKQVEQKSFTCNDLCALPRSHRRFDQLGIWVKTQCQKRHIGWHNQKLMVLGLVWRWSSFRPTAPLRSDLIPRTAGASCALRARTQWVSTGSLHRCLAAVTTNGSVENGKTFNSQPRTTLAPLITIPNMYWIQDTVGISTYISNYLTKCAGSCVLANPTHIGSHRCPSQNDSTFASTNFGRIFGL